TRCCGAGDHRLTNGLIGSSGRTGQKRRLLELLDRLAPSYGDDWWFTAPHGMALSENGQRVAARPKIDRSVAANPKNAWAAHSRAHLCYEEGDPNGAATSSRPGSSPIRAMACCIATSIGISHSVTSRPVMRRRHSGSSRGPSHPMCTADRHVESSTMASPF